MRQCLTDPVHFAVNVGIYASHPFVIDHEGLDLRLGQFGVFGIGGGIQLSLRCLDRFPKRAAFIEQFQYVVDDCPSSEHLAQLAA